MHAADSGRKVVAHVVMHNRLAIHTDIAVSIVEFSAWRLATSAADVWRSTGSSLRSPHQPLPCGNPCLSQTT